MLIDDKKQIVNKKKYFFVKKKQFYNLFINNCMVVYQSVLMKQNRKKVRDNGYK